MSKSRRSPGSADPLRIDQSFRDLLGALSEERDDALKLRLLEDQLRDLLGLSEDAAYSYLLQLGARYLDLAGHIVLETEPPARIDRALDLIGSLRERLGRRFDPVAGAEARANLLFQKARQCFYLGEIGQGFQALLDRHATPGGPGADGAAGRRRSPGSAGAAALPDRIESRLEGESNFEMFNEFLARTRTGGPVRLDLEDILEKWRRVEDGADPDSVNTVLVVRDPSLAEDRRGVVLPLSVYAKRMSSLDNQPLVHFNNASPASRNELLNVAQDSVAAAEVLYHQKHGPAGRALYFNFSFPDKAGTYAGHSIGLALALLAFNRNLVIRDERRSLLFRTRVAVTGETTLRGEVSAADVPGLRRKIEAAFFSPLRALVVPRQNLAEARDFLYRLLAEHPRRRFTLIPAASLEEIVANRDVCLVQKLPFLRFVLRHSSLALRYALSLAAFGGLLWSGLFLWRHPELHFWKERTPAKVEFLADSFVVRNRDDQVIWKYRAPGELLPNPTLEFSLAADITDDGRTEFICPLSVKEADVRTSPIYCFSDRGKLLWKYVPGREVRTRVETFSNRYNGRAIAAVPLGPGRGKGILIGASHSPWYPFQLTLLDAAGDKVGEFWNSGHFSPRATAVEDIDGDGVPEIIIGGQNNGYNAACLAVFDPRNLRGASPQHDTPDFELEGMAPGSEEFYILFPPSILNRLFRVRNFVDSLTVNREEKTIEVLVREYSDPGQGGVYILRYLFDYRLNVLKCKPEDDYLAKLKELHTMKVIPGVTREDIESWKDLVRFWDGEKWTTTPSRNRAAKAEGR